MSNSETLKQLEELANIKVDYLDLPTENQIVVIAADLNQYSDGTISMLYNLLIKKFFPDKNKIMFLPKDINFEIMDIEEIDLLIKQLQDIKQKAQG